MTARARSLDLTFGALADPVRRKILTRLAKGESTVGELARPFRVSRPAISKHLRVLERAGLVNRSRQGRVSRLTLTARPMADAAEWVERYRRFWEHQFDSLAEYLERDTRSPWRATSKESASGRPTSGGRRSNDHRVQE